MILGSASSKSRWWFSVLGGPTAHTCAHGFTDICDPGRVAGAQIVGVEIMIAHNPLHGSGRAGFPHPALALGDDAHAAQGIGMTDDRQRQPASDEAPHAIPQNAAFLAAPRQRAMPEPPYLGSKNPQRVVVPRHTVIPDV